jgi:hypothetical protein
MSQRTIRAQVLSLSILLLLPSAPRLLAQGVTFAPIATYDAGGYRSRSAAVADFNRDGKPDLAILNSCGASIACTSGNDTVGILLGSGGGSFLPAVTYSTSGQGVFLAAADVNHDGNPDLIVLTEIVSVLLGNGDGTFKPAVTYPLAPFPSPNYLTVADINGDGNNDLIVSAENCAGSPGCIQVLMGNGDGTFQSASQYNLGNNTPYGMAVGDLNGDGKLDLVVATCALVDGEFCYGAANATVLLGNGDGTFQPAETYGTGGGFATTIAIADVNGDGKPDIVVANPQSSCSSAAGGCTGPPNLAVLLGNGNGTFQNAVIYPSGGPAISESMAVADMNGDGKPDVVILTTPSECATTGSCSPGSVQVLLGNGDGTLQAPVSFNTVSYVPPLFAMAVADVSGDGKPDLVIANACSVGTLCAVGDAIWRGTVSVLINTTGLEETTTALTSSLNPSNLGQSVTYTARVTSQSGTPAGSVTFTIRGNQPVSVPLSNGQASFAWTFANPGSLSVTAAYSGNATYAPSTSAPLTQIINPPVVTITGSPLQPLHQITGDVTWFTVTNTGNVTVSSLRVTVAGTTLGGGSLISAPAPVTNLAPGATALILLSFPPLPSGTATATLKVTGTYSVSSPPISGNWALTFRSVALTD